MAGLGPRALLESDRRQEWQCVQGMNLNVGDNGQLSLPRIDVRPNADDNFVPF